VYGFSYGDTYVVPFYLYLLSLLLYSLFHWWAK
jgi:hypothetical protein